MRLDVWIEKTGPKEVAKQLKVDPSTISNWRTGKSFPKPERLVQLYKLSMGRVTYAEMIQHFLSKN